MKRVYILCEGQTEETFVNAVLSPYFTPQGIYVTPVVLATKRIASGGKHKGGVSSYEKISKDLRLLCRDGGAYVTSLLDYFALPEDTPGFSVEAPSLYEHIEMIEQAINQDIGKANCHANLLVHEFEGLLFSAPEEFAGAAPCAPPPDQFCSPRRRNLPLLQSEMRLMLFVLFVKNTPIPRRSIRLSIQLRQSVSLR